MVSPRQRNSRLFRRFVGKVMPDEIQLPVPVAVPETADAAPTPPQPGFRPVTMPYVERPFDKPDPQPLRVGWNPA